jgi:hypothetical protein
MSSRLFLTPETRPSGTALASPADYSRVLLQFAADVSRTGDCASLPGPAMTEASGLDSRLDRPALCLASALDFAPAVNFP